jgi:NCS1 family nucleobase:cation symporter-1
MDNSLTYMYFLGLVFAPICGIQIADYYFFRHQRLDMVSLFDYTPSSHYHFWGGVNPAAFAATAVGFFVYWYLLDPVTYVSHNTMAFKWISASIPSLVSAAVVYAVLTALVVKPLHKGGYERVAAVALTPARPAGEPVAGVGE